MLAKIVNYTNIFYKIKNNLNQIDQKQNNQQKVRSHHKKWKDIDLDKIQDYIRCILHMGILKLPEIGLHWSTNVLLKTPQIRQVLSYDEFNLITRYLKIAN